MSNKVVFQKGDNKIELEYRPDDETPHWSTMKDGSGRMVTDFVNSFVSALIPTFIVFMIFIIIVYNFVC